MSDNKMILLGISGGIAAYKSCELVRILQKRGHVVKVVMTKHATSLVGPATFRALTGHPVALDLFEDPAKPIHHISLAQEADCFVIAPATANVIAKIAQGVADDLLTTTAVAYQGSLVIAPAMNEAMLDDEVTQDNLAILRARGVRIVDPESGYLACGDKGTGRLADIEQIAQAVEEELTRSADLVGKRVVITAGPTQEPIDAVRFISNHSSGKMGYALAQEALACGAEVALISGPTALRAPVGATLVSVQTAREMQTALMDASADANIIICAAAVSDFRPAKQFDNKLKKTNREDIDHLESIQLVENADLLAEVGRLRNAGELSRNPVIVGFAAETDDLIENARRKLASKGVDFIIANDVSKDDIGFNSDNNEVYVISHSGEQHLEHAPKRVIARQILDATAYVLRK
jgi:phosphopantothenoylcysteine decarboxylase/phosphopantothenate--cysteine ligase